MEDQKLLIKQLLDLPPKSFAKVPISDQVRELMEATRPLKKSALKRQIGFINKNLDEEQVQTIRNHLQELSLASKRQNQSFHRVEDWRDRLIEGDANLEQEILEKFPQSRQQIRQFIRNAIKEHQLNQQMTDQGKQPEKKHSRQLFKLLNEVADLEQSDN